MTAGPVAPRPFGAGAPEIPDGERVIVPTSIYAPGSLPGQPDGDGPAPGARPRAGYPAGPGQGPAQGAHPGYVPPPAYGGAAGYGDGPVTGHPASSGYPPPGPGRAQGRGPTAGYATAPGYAPSPGPSPAADHPASAGYAPPGPGGAAGYGPGAAADHPASAGYAPPGPGGAPGYGAGRTVPPGYAPPPRPAGQAYHPASPPDEGTVNGGSYAYVIREEEAPARPGPRGNQPPPQERPRPEPPAFIYRDPATPAVADEPPAAYGPDDPAYGPPSADWYTREDQAEEWAADDPGLARGPFEPPAAQAGSGQQPVPGLLVAGDPGGGAAMPLDQIREFYLTAAAISQENLDRHFGELLERQRELISEYFKEAGLEENPR